MQSGISASAELHEAFTSFLADPSIFCLPVTISSEALVPLQQIALPPNTPQTDQFLTALPLLEPHLEPNVPLYLILRRILGGVPTLIALTYIPSTSPVRAKTLFASTRATLVRELGGEKFSSIVFATDKEEVISEQAWRERDASDNAAKGAGEDDDAARQELMGQKERELHAIKREESQARNQSGRRDIGIGGMQDTGVPFPVDDAVNGALQEVATEEGKVARLGMDLSNNSERLILVSTESNVAPADLAKVIPENEPQYTFYRYPNSTALVFIYTCPPSTSIKQRMVYASSRRSALHYADLQGLKITHKIEASSGSEITVGRLEEEVNPPREEGPKRAFARPKRPGR
ncbi:hypothetical protein AJ80_02189 [Polytolypa hystricis UAMH7299]|uniref:ADF-H domain-containing protein n=1 Tax=Polytolypa hystricis (strain UAMH7299) TaxID=1447883 RepID=A0A2B7YRT5_POLH7|nr:hypothetical protein AJ80_02189 [Polytolypa hystricis UAMH7299]